MNNQLKRYDIYREEVIFSKRLVHKKGRLKYA